MKDYLDLVYGNDNRPIDLKDYEWVEDYREGGVVGPPRPKTRRYNSDMSKKFGGIWLDYEKDGKWKHIQITSGAKIYELKVTLESGEEMRMYSLSREVIQNKVEEFLDSKNIIHLEIKKHIENVEVYIRCLADK